MPIQVDGLEFHFPTNWHVEKYDEWAFYRNQFCRTTAKAVDLLAVSPHGEAYLIEAKDYRMHKRTKPSDVGDEFARKAIDTLAALMPAHLNANNSNEKSHAKRVLEANKIRLVLHLEQPLKHSKLFPRAIDPADVKQRIRSMLKAIDPHPIVSERSRMAGLPWTVA